MSAITADDVTRFMADYASAMNEGVQQGLKDPARLADAFAKDLIAASPAGIMAARSDGLAEIIARGIVAYRDMGGTAFIAENIETTELAPTSFMASVDWRFDYKRPRDGKSGSIAFTNRYFVNAADGKPKIFAWITPDEQAALKEHGLA